MTDAIHAARAVVDTWMTLTNALPVGWTHRSGDVLAAFSGVAVPALNGVWIAEADPDPAVLAALLNDVRARGLPHCVQCRPVAAAIAERIANERGMKRDTDVPLMTLDLTRGLPERSTPRGLAIRQLRAEEAEVHARIAADGFEVPPEPFVQLIQPSILMLDSVRCYVGTVDGEAVVTGLGVTLGDGVGVFNIATRPHARGRGYASALTTRAVSDGMHSGARWAWLQSTRAGYPLYDRLGFRTVERWSCWLAFPETAPAA